MAAINLDIARGGKLGGKGFAGGAVRVMGVKELDRKFAHLGTRGARAVLAAGINAELGVLAKAFRQQIKNSNASDEMKREARRTVGKRFRRGGTSRIGKTSTPVAKVGFAVGKRQKQISAAKKARGKRVAKSGKKGRGVGISAANIHWPVLGTDERRHEGGKSTGRMPDVFRGLARRVIASVSSVAIAAASAVMRQRIVIEARKKR